MIAIFIFDSQPLRAKHCRVCNICVYRFDHHCIYTNNCVGAANQKSFLIFLSVEIFHVCFMGYVLYCIGTQQGKFVKYYFDKNYSVFIVKQHESWSLETVHLMWQVLLPFILFISLKQKIRRSFSLPTALWVSRSFGSANSTTHSSIGRQMSVTMHIATHISTPLSILKRVP